MGFKKGQDRYQVSLLPPVIDDYIAKNDEVRVIDKFVDGLDIKFQHSDFSGRGNQPYDPKDMLKIYIFCYLNGIRSSRKIEKECQSSIKLIWLTGNLRPDDKTICDFRKNNKEQLHQVLKDFTVFCQKAKLFSTELIAIDGSKFKASNSINKIYSKKILKKKIQFIDEKINDFLNEIEKNDSVEMKIERLDGDKVLEIINNFEKEKEKYSEILRELEDNNETQKSITDKDCRIMHKRNGEINPCYNVQVAADSKYNLIVDFDITNHVSDIQELSNMATKAKETLNVDKLEVVADAGYFNRDEIEKCVENNITPIVNISKVAKHNDKFSKDKFAYDKMNDVYICPAKRKLYYVKDEMYNHGKRKQKRRIYADKDKCKNCEFREQCFQNKKSYRKITRWDKEDLVDNMRTLEAKEKLKRRKSIIEPVFGVFKNCFGFNAFLTRGLNNVKSEISLQALVYNLKRTINILGIEKLLDLMTC